MSLQSTTDNPDAVPAPPTPSASFFQGATGTNAENSIFIDITNDTQEGGTKDVHFYGDWV